MTSCEEAYCKAVDALTDDSEDEFDLVYALCKRVDVDEAGKADSEVVHAADLDLLKAARRALRDIYVPTEGERWWHNLAAIARGEYPLEKLPEHIRELARELYYR